MRVQRADIKDAVIMFSHKSEFTFFGRGEGTRPDGTKDIAFPPGAKNAPPEGLGVDFLVLQMDDFGDPSRQDVEVCRGVAPREIVPPKDFEEGLFDEGGVD